MLLWVLWIKFCQVDTMELTTLVSSSWCEEAAGFKYIKTVLQQQKVNVALHIKDFVDALEYVQSKSEQFIKFKQEASHDMRICDICATSFLVSLSECF